MLQDFRNRFMTYEHIEIDECPLKYLRSVYTDFCHVALVKKNGTTCLGVLVNDYYILSTAECVPEDWKSVQVQLQNEFDLPIADRLVYPDYKALNVSSENAPILLRINGTIEFILPKENTAACLWPVDNVISYSKVQDVAFDATLGKLIQNTTVCSASMQQECLNKTFAQWCERKPAGSLLQIRDLDRYSMHPMVAALSCDDRQQQLVPVSRYADWIRDVIARDRILFAIPDAGLGEKCITKDDKEGVCLRLEACPQVYKQLKGKGRKLGAVEQCGFDGGDLLNCCTPDDMLRGEDKREKLGDIRREIEHCHELYDVYRRTTKEQQLHAQLALVRGEEDKVECVGTLIAKQFVLTAAQCALRIKPKTGTVQLGAAGQDPRTLQIRTVSSTIVHPMFDHHTNHYNIALLALDAPIAITEYSVPACMWPEKDRLPAKLTSTAYDAASHKVQEETVNPLYYIDCRLKHYANLTLTEACVLPDADVAYCGEEPTACAESGTGLYGTVYMSADWRPVNYVVGIYSYGAQCAQGRPAVYTRVSEYYPWIKAQLYLTAQEICRQFTIGRLLTFIPWNIQCGAIAMSEIRFAVLRAVAVMCCMVGASATLFPSQAPDLEALDQLMPNVERSVKDCPYTIYQHGGIALASSIFVDRYVDKTYSHTVRVLNGELTCVGLIVDETHVLTTSDCTSTEDGSLPEIKLTNETLPTIETIEQFPHAEYNVTLLRLNSSITYVDLNYFSDRKLRRLLTIQLIDLASNGNLSMEETKCTFQNRKECLMALLKTSGILQTRAIAHYRMHPFVFAFGSDDEGLALPVTKYISWMEEVLERKIKSSECTLMYSDFRDYEDSMVSGSNEWDQVQYSKSRLTTTSIDQYRVRILPQTAEPGSKRHCYGSLISPKFILTAANCLRQYEVEGYDLEMAQRYVYYPEPENMIRVRTEAKKVHYHPEFDADTLANDIALLEMVKPLYSFNKTVLPACIWTHEKLPVEQVQTNGYAPFNESSDATVRTTQFYATADVYEQCLEKVPQHQFCAGFPTALAPNSCHNSIGSAMSRSLYALDRYFEYIFAINSKGENCGFNMPTVYTRIAPYVRWIDSIIFGTKVHYEDDTKYYGDRCQDGSGADGTCVSLPYCPKLDQVAKQGNAVNQSSSCSFGKQKEMVVCCSEENVLRDETHREQLAEAIKEIDSCPHLYHEHRKNKSPYDVDNFPIYPYMALIHDTEHRTCNGTLVAKQFVLTTASCYQSLAQDSITVALGNSTQQKMAVQRTFTHPEYSNVSTEFNLILLKLETAATINNETIPACLWKNQTHTPLRLEEVYMNGNSSGIDHQYAHPLYNEECLRMDQHSNVTGLQLCVVQDRKYYQRSIFFQDGAGIGVVSHAAEGVNEYQVTYLVGMYGTGRMAKHDSTDFYHIYQRVSEHYGWIKNVITVEMQQDIVH
uniref:Peptidase S1 domain-containing protein n=1 Tax=Anopheles epiroticus TaxID=199890 RepID=A0A182PTS7_9DIPT